MKRIERGVYQDMLLGSFELQAKGLGLPAAMSRTGLKDCIASLLIPIRKMAYVWKK